MPDIILQHEKTTQQAHAEYIANPNPLYPPTMDTPGAKIGAENWPTQHPVVKGRASPLDNVLSSMRFDEPLGADPRILINEAGLERELDRLIK